MHKYLIQYITHIISTYPVCPVAPATTTVDGAVASSALASVGSKRREADEVRVCDKIVRRLTSSPVRASSWNLAYKDVVDDDD